MDVVSIVIAVLVGVGIGVLSGMLGIGGGTVMVPVFKLGFGMTAIGSTATSLFAIIPTAISGSITHVRQKTCIPKLGVLAGVGGACMSPVGVWLASQSQGWMIMLAAAIVIGYSSFTMFRKAMSAPRAGSAPADDGSNRGASGESPVARGGAPRASSMGSGIVAHYGSPAGVPPAGGAGSAEPQGPAPKDEGVSFETVTSPAGESGSTKVQGRLSDSGIDPRRLWLGLPIGLVAGLVAGYVGVGGGFLMVPLFLSVIGVDMKHASGSSLLAIAILSTPGAIMQILMGNVAIAIAIAVVVGSVPGAMLGARLIKRIPERELRFLFAGVLLIAAILLVLQEIGMF